MKFSIGRLTALAMGIAIVCSSAVSSADIVYDNSQNLGGFLIESRDVERGDTVTLAGTARQVDRIDLGVFSLGGADSTADMQVRFYDGGEGGVDDPGALLWDSGVLTAQTMFAGQATYSFAVPNVTVGDSFTWTLSLTNSTALGLTGSRFAAPPTVGSSEDFVWRRNGDGTWARELFNVGVDGNSYDAVISAVPEPGSIAFLALGSIALVARRRK